MEENNVDVFSSPDQFHVDESLGKGAFGQVFRIRSKSLSKQYAMKRIEFDGITQAMRRMALCEGYFLKQLQHEHIVSFHGCFSNDGIGYLIMELFAAGTMKKLIKQRRGMHFLEVEIAKWMGQFATALKYCHFKHVIHRDLKTEHLYVDALGQLKLGGFGFAKSEDVKTDEREELIGTPTHMAPELWLDVVGSNHAYNRLTDVWAYGVCCYEIANLALPFKYSANIESMSKAICHLPVKPITREMSMDLRRLIQVGLLNRNHNHRSSLDDVLGNAVVSSALHSSDHHS